MTASRTRSNGPRLAHFAAALLTSTMLSGVPLAFAQTLPTGGSVAAGSATIGTPSNGALTVTQSSSSAVVNWQSFSVAQGNAVNFVQPSSTSAILNRVTGSATSTIAGQINANGQVYLVNPNGIAITSTGTVNAAGFVASTLGISDSDFMSGKRTFTGNGASASVSNAGSITIGRGGYAALLGGSVDNAGTITVPLGKVGLGSGEQATLDLSGDGFMQVAMPTNATGSSALVSNSGRISANGGSVQLSAAAARDMARQAINMSGTIEARSVGGRNGAIILGGSDGAVAVSGKLNVSSRKAKGGSIAVTGRDIKLAGATLEASGKIGGGTVRIGGNRQGQGTLQRAETTTVDAATTIKADATSMGNGGDVVVWSDGTTAVYGTISARGGKNGGDGGQIETSGHTLDFAGIRVDASAFKGAAGTWLLDPIDLIVDATAAATINSALGGGTGVTLQTFASSAPSGSGSTAAGNGDIIINSSLGWSTSAVLTLNAHNAISINAAINVRGAGGVSLVYNTASPTNLTFNNGASIDYGATNNGGALSVNGNAYTLLYSMTDIAGMSTSGHSALATDLISTTSYTAAVVGGTFNGTFEGLGHTISNLTINSTASGELVGLFRYATGTIRDIGLVGGSISAGTSSYVGALVGGLGAGSSPSYVVNSYATANVTGGDQSNVGGLIGETYAYQDAPTVVASSYSTGNVTTGVSGYAGGLVGQQVAYFNSASATISGSHATGTVTGGSNAVLGGLVGSNSSNPTGIATITGSYATGAVIGTTASSVGGLVGSNTTNAGISSISGSFATGAVNGGAVANGGLVGSNTGGGAAGIGSITDSYATGAVTGGGAGYNGGLVGWNLGNGSGAVASITTSYATGSVSTTGYGGTGGLVGRNQNLSGGTTSIISSYWDVSTSGIPALGIGNDTNGQSGNVIGVTTAQFQSGSLPTGFSSSVWGTGAGLYPYLTSIFAHGVQAVSGTVYSDLGTTPLASGTNGAVGVTVIGANATLGTVTAGANGYYYAFGAAGTIANGAGVVAYTTQNGSTGATNAARIATSTYSSGTPSQTGVDIYEPVTLLTASTSATTLSASGYNPNSTPAVPTGSTLPSFLNGAIPTLAATNSGGFTIDQTLDLTSSFGVQTTAGAPLTVANAMTVESGASLGLMTSGQLFISAPVTVKGAGAVTLIYNSAFAGNLSFGLTGAGFTGRLSYVSSDGTPATSNQGGALTINGTGYTLLYSMADVTNINTLDLFGKYALANSLDASGTTYTGALIGTGVDGNSIFRGRFDGLGHTISNLTIATSGDYAGLFGFAYGTIQNVGLVGGSVTGTQHVGSLIGSLSYGTITNVYATGSVRGTTYVGGLIGLADTINSITSAYATGTVTGTDSYAGGLIGFLYNYSSLANSYATGAVAGNQYVGGLVGANLNLSPISNVYATGAVIGGSYVGGLSGWIGSSDTTNAYAMGAVIGGAYVGGLAGGNGNGRTISNSYWDIQTTGQAMAFGSDGNGQSGNITGLTTAQFQTPNAAAYLGPAFAGGAGLYPYLQSFFPNGVQAISGMAYNNAGTTPAASGANGAVTVTAFANGTGFGSATTGANGYYYIMGAAGSIASGNSLLTYTSANAATGTTNSARLGTATSAANQSGLDLYGNAVTVVTTSTTLSAAPTFSAAQASAIAAIGSDATATAVINAITGQGFIASGASFTIDQTVDTAGPFYVQTTAASAPITVANSITIETGGSLSLNAAGALNLHAPITVKGAGGVALGYDSSSATNFSFGLTGSGFISQLTFLDASGNGLTSAPGNQSLSINGTAYALLYTMADVANVTSAGLAGNYALANSLDAAGTTYSDALIGPNSGNIFSGVFQGLGHTISNLTIAKNGDNVGLIGYSSGLIQNIGLVNASVSETNSFGRYVGGLVGYQSGNTITNAYVTGAVRGGSNTGGLVGYLNGGSIVQAYSSAMVSGTTAVGGLAGYVGGTVSTAYATGAVTATGDNAGGLIGVTDSSTYAASVTDAYATGAVLAGNRVGGLIGFSFGTLNNVYATGAVSGGGAGGLVGYAYGGSIGNAYWDIDTTGTSTVIANDPNGLSSNITVRTTAQFQTLAATSALGAAFGGGAGLYPYLRSFFPNGVQAISGVAYTDGGATVLGSGVSGAGLVNVRVGSGAVQTVTTGVNGYYYAIVPYGSIDTTNGSNVLAFTQANANTGAADGSAFRTAAMGTLANFDVSGGWRRDTTALSTLSILDAAYATSTTGTSASSLTLANRSIFAVTDFSFDTALSLTGTLNLSSTGTVTQSAAISAGTLMLQGGGNTFTLTNAGNQFSQFVAAGGTINLYNAGNLTIAASATDACNCTLAGVSGDGIQIATAGDLTIAAGASISGTSPVLAASGAFLNYAGSNAVTATSGRWLIYSADSAGNTFGGLDSNNTAIWSTAAGGNVTAAGNRYVFASGRTLTVTTLNDSKTYGEDITGRVATDYVITGFAPGVAGAYLADTASTAYSGTASVTSPGAAGTASVAGSTYAITAALGSLASNVGYGFAFANLGTLTVNRRGITVTADPKSRIYGEANPALTYVVGGLGLVNGDTLSGSLTTLATGTSNVGSYGITQGSLAASSNYALTYVGADLDVAVRDLRVTADSKSRIYGDANPALTYAIGGLGLINGDLLSGALATDADRNSIAGRYAINRGNLSASANYAVTFVPGTLTINAVINPPSTDLASTAASSMPAGATITAAMLPVVVSPPSASGSANGSGSIVISADPRFDGVVICSGLNCVVAQ